MCKVEMALINISSIVISIVAMNVISYLNSTLHMDNQLAKHCMTYLAMFELDTSDKLLKNGLSLKQMRGSKW